jgi:hypothetical protein
MKKLLCVGATVAAMAVLPLAAQASTIAGDLNISGNVASATFTPTGSVNFTADPGISTLATGDFDALVVTIFEATFPPNPTTFTLNDIDFTAPPGVIYFNADISFTATSYFGFDNVPDPSAGFGAFGTINVTGFDPTPGVFGLSVQNDLANVSFSSTTSAVPLPGALPLFASGLGALGFVGWRKRKKAKLAA